MIRKIITTITITLIIMQFAAMTANAAGADNESVPESTRQSFDERATEMQGQFNQQAAANQAWFNQQVANNQALYEERSAKMQSEHEKRVAEMQAQSDKRRAEMQARAEERRTENQAWFNQQVAETQASHAERVAEMKSTHEANAAAMQADYNRGRQNIFTFFIIAVVTIIVIRIIMSVLKKKGSAQGTCRSGHSGNSGSGFSASTIPGADDMHNNFIIQEQNRLSQEQMQRDMDEATRCSMNASYNAMSDADFACTGIDSFGHDPF